MTLFKWVLAIVLGLFLIAFGIMKFTGPNPIFAWIEFRSGLGFAEPFGAWMTGVMEILAGLLVIVPATRKVGALLGTGVIGGAVAMHLSPFLGVATPAGFTEGAVRPWDASDFLPTETGLFYLALVMLILALTNLWLARR